MSKNVEIRKRFVELRSKGVSFSNIAAELGISKQTAISWSHKLKLKIENLQALEWDALREQCKLSGKHRVTILSEQLEKARIELLNRDFSDIPTEKLVDVCLKLTSSLKAEDRPPTFSHVRPSQLDVCGLMEETVSWTA